MTERKPCIRCSREIDGVARICPFCNWDQAESPSTDAAQMATTPAYIPPKDRRVQRKLLMVGGGVALLVVSFLVGALIHGSDPKDVEEETPAAATETTSRPRRSNVTLVPVTDDDLEAPITSAPLTTTAAGLPTEYQRSDATAASSDEYALLAARVKEERRKAREAVDPRSLSGAAYETSAPRRQRAEAPAPPSRADSRTNDDRPFDREMPSAGLPTRAPDSGGSDSRGSDSRRADPLRADSRRAADSRAPDSSTATRTRPVPEYQPLPDIQVSRRMTARLDLVIGADGRVKEVTIRDVIPGETSKLIRAVQSWRFKPATENGQPVSAPYSVDLSFNANE